ncbi:hypothetical protein BC835DRAFT_1303857 [Cytidiella melzeri]|nr:hypothetical protein BC835DRAFT_1303857 [Cytidiella melzeri]
MSRVGFLARRPLPLVNVASSTKGCGKSDATTNNTSDKQANILLVKDTTQKWNLIPVTGPNSTDDNDPYFFIQHAESRFWAHVKPNPTEKEEIVSRDSTATLWRMGYNKDKKGHYIYPAVKSDLFWGIDKTDDDTKLTLRKDKTDTKNLWNFE